MSLFDEFKAICLNADFWTSLGHCANPNLLVRFTRTLCESASNDVEVACILRQARVLVLARFEQYPKHELSCMNPPGEVSLTLGLCWICWNAFFWNKGFTSVEGGVTSLLVGRRISKHCTATLLCIESPMSYGTLMCHRRWRLTLLFNG